MFKYGLLAILGFASLIQATGAATAKPADTYRISGPVVHENLAVYFVHGKSRPGPVPLTLQEALTKQTVEIRETGQVNILEVKNTGTEAVFIQSGDIVKGGRQDRVLSVSMLLPPHSQTVPIPVFCVEQHRWTGRSGENAALFASSNRIIPSRAAKMAMLRSTPKAAGALSGVYARQSRIWQDVTAIQGKLSSSLGAPVASARSRSSLQLALENKKLEHKQAEFTTKLQKFGEAAADIVGYVVAINGRINSAEIYPSNGLFRKMWPRLLRASATEAIADKDATTSALPTVAGVKSFLDGADQARGVDKAASATTRLNVRESMSAVLFEARPAVSPSAAPSAAPPATTWINRSYLAR